MLITIVVFGSCVAGWIYQTRDKPSRATTALNKFKAQERREQARMNDDEVLEANIEKARQEHLAEQRQFYDQDAPSPLTPYERAAFEGLERSLRRG